MDQGWYIVFCLALRCTALCTVGTRIWLDKGESGRVVLVVVEVVDIGIVQCSDQDQRMHWLYL
jgi:hypothetical protein